MVEEYEPASRALLANDEQFNLEFVVVLACAGLLEADAEGAYLFGGTPPILDVVEPAFVPHLAQEVDEVDIEIGQARQFGMVVSHVVLARIRRGRFPKVSNYFPGKQIPVGGHPIEREYELAVHPDGHEFIVYAPKTERDALLVNQLALVVRHPKRADGILVAKGVRRNG